MWRNATAIERAAPSITDAYSPGRPTALYPASYSAPDHSGALEQSAPLLTRTVRMAADAISTFQPDLERAKSRFGPNRIGLLVGTTVSGIPECADGWAVRLRTGDFPQAFRVEIQAPGDPALSLRRDLGIDGITYGISTACTSSGHALVSAARLLRLGLCDAVVAGGVDVLCAFTVTGFQALEASSPLPTLPSSLNRRGINLGEGAAFFLLSREPGELPVHLAGYAATSDAHHISSPDPSGVGAEGAMRDALSRAGLTPGDVDYINLHGTGTRQNDAMEHHAVARVFTDPTRYRASSTKALTGHTLGAASAIEAALCVATLRDNPDGHIPPHHYDGVDDPELSPLPLARPGDALGRQPHVALSNSFAFGGSNLSLVFVRS